MQSSLGALSNLDNNNYLEITNPFIIDHVMELVASVSPSVHLRALSCLNHLTYNLDFWYGGQP